MKTVNHIFIGKDVARTCTVLVPTASTATNLAEGEVIVADKNKKLLTTGSTIADTDRLFIGVGLADTYLNSSGKTGRYIKWSAPIIGRDVVGYNGKAYAASSPKVVAVRVPTIASGQEAVLRINYTDTEAAQLTPGQFIEEYRLLSSGTGAITWARRIASKINGSSDPRIVATLAGGATAMTLTGKTKPGSTLNDIDPYTLVNFDARVFYAYGKTAPLGVNCVTTTTSWTPGEGNWAQVRDKEKAAKAQEGLINATTFPIPTGFTTWMTVKDETYDTIVIKHNNTHQTSDMDYLKKTDGATYIYIPNVTSTANQMSNVKDALNTYMGSLGFTDITVF